MTTSSSANCVSEIVCVFPAGNSLGITFEWDEGLKVTDVLPIEDSESNRDVSDGVVSCTNGSGESKHPETYSPEASAVSSSFEPINRSKLSPGDILVSVNGCNVLNMTFDEVVALLRASETEQRSLVFHHVLTETVASVSVPESRINTAESKISQADEESLSSNTSQSLLPNCTVMHSNISHALNSSTKLRALHVNVVNLSYWYKQRSLLGGRKHNALIVQQNSQSMRWESAMFVYRPREDTGDMAPQRKFLSTHSSKWSAYRHCESCTKERDSNPALSKKLGATIVAPENILDTHYRIIVVSEVFYRMKHVDRVALVYSELLREIGTQANPDYSPESGEGHAPPGYMNLFHTIGRNVCNLPLFRFIVTKKPLNLIIEAITPSQWKPHIYPAPLSERFGNSHGEFRALQVEPAARDKSHRNRVMTLTNKANDRGPFNTPATPGSADGRRTSDDLQQASAELLGLDSEVLAKQFRKKTGGVYGHFFKDLTPSVRDMVMQQFVENKKMIQKEGARMKGMGKRRVNISDMCQPKTTMSIMRAKLKASMNTADYDKGTNSEEEMLEEFLIAAKRTERVAIRLQRMYRMRAVRIVQHKLWREQWAAISIQRIVRGRFARLYYRLLKKLVPIAIKRIIVTYRYYQRKKRLEQWFILVKKATLVIAPILKKFVRKCVSRWMKRYNTAARTIQTGLRIYLAKMDFYRRVGQRFLDVDVYWAVVCIQSTFRGFLGRRKVELIIQERMANEIDIPAAICMQRIIRGKIGRRILARKKLEHYAAINIQKYMLRYHVQLYYIRLRRVLLEKFSAIQIQRMYRGRLDRELADHRRHAKWYREKFIPAIISTQAVVRMHIQLKAFQTFKHLNRSALKIQLGYRVYKARVKFSARYREFLLKLKGKVATKIQCMVRRYLAKKYFKEKLWGVVSKRMLAAKTILRAWVNFTARRRLDHLMSEHRARLHHEKTLKMKKLREEILEDLIEIRKDIEASKTTESKARHRAKVLDNFIIESEMRIPDLENSMENIDAEDLDKGWGEAWGTEYEMLIQQKSMAREELRLRRVQLKKAEDEQEELHLELEDTELELDRVATSEVASYEFLRQSEINEIYKRLKRIRDREIRIEKTRWGIHSKRVKVIHRKRNYFQGIREKTQESRGLPYATSVAFETKALQWDKEDIITRRKERRAYRDLTKDVYRYEDYAGPVQETFDDVVSNSLSLLRHMTLDERVHRMQVGFANKQKEKRKKKGGLTFALKPHFKGEEKVSAFQYLNSSDT
eukprot:CAMPEP_0185039458 /NCGR_PEP_ID=MMETSP1103-20130426/36337_1 /TAXON_ID=36769 /ORGANISM="Paraphysomonas bandaiensis, Strain Caron Lab Isolate" /LENGTH=1261 /DNA_ID=CAMNT_0027578349 /DNA_START=138 /DNA_END=3923 /DNA_ORIENTATION=-